MLVSERIATNRPIIVQALHATGFIISDMGCAEHARLIDGAAKLLAAEKATRELLPSSMSAESLAELQSGVHAKVIGAEYELNRHIDECPSCRGDHKTHVTLTHVD